jgi:hypothetical protein
MMIRKLVLVAVLTAASSTVIAQGLMPGTPEEQAACRLDTRRFCHAIKPKSGTESFLSCLQEHRERLSRACRAVLESHGQ